jgi:hypothetical protein
MRIALAGFLVFIGVVAFLWSSVIILLMTRAASYRDITVLQGLELLLSILIGVTSLGFGGVIALLGRSIAAPPAPGGMGTS